jgi:hypothetical protein
MGNLDNYFSDLQTTADEQHLIEEQNRQNTLQQAKENKLKTLSEKKNNF